MRISNAIAMLEELREQIGDAEVVFSDTLEGPAPTPVEKLFPLAKVKHAENGAFTIFGDCNGRN